MGNNQMPIKSRVGKLIKDILYKKIMNSNKKGKLQLDSNTHESNKCNSQWQNSAQNNSIF